MTSRAAVDDFLARKTLAVVGVSRQGNKFGNGHCILMFAEPTGLGHRLHRWVWGLLGKLPS